MEAEEATRDNRQESAGRVVNWIERLALEDDNFRRNGGEVWRNFKLALSSTVDSFNKIYAKPGQKEFEVSDCRRIDDNCFRIRSIPSLREKENVIEFWLKSDKHLIAITPNAGKALSLAIVAGKSGLELQYDSRTISEDDASRLILEKLLFPGGIRREPLNPPKPDPSDFIVAD